MTPVLAVRGIEVGYGPIKALHGIDLEVNRGEIVTLIGANGAGKTTTLRTISGLLRPRTGEVHFEGTNITGAKPHRIAARGISHVPEGRGIFANLTVHDNLELGAYLRKDAIQQGEYERVFALFPVLRDRIHQSAGTLSGGEQQMLAISRALLARPAVLLLDEPSLGLAPIVTRKLFEILAGIAREEGTTLLIVEQNAKLVLGFADYGYVLEAGSIAISGSADELSSDERVQRSYLGY